MCATAGLGKVAVHPAVPGALQAALHLSRATNEAATHVQCRLGKMALSHHIDALISCRRSHANDRVFQQARESRLLTMAAAALLASATTPLSARLLIHATDGARESHGSLADALQRWRALVAPGVVQRRRSIPTGVHIDDLEGRPFFASEDIRALIDVPLPAGTYHVNVRLGEVRRRYTVTLEQGVTFNLYLRLSADLAARHR